MSHENCLKEINHIKTNNKAQSEFVRDLDKEIGLLKHDYTRIEKSIDKLEETIKELTIEMRSARDQFILHAGGSAMKSKMWLIAYSILTAACTAGLIDYFVKMSGLK